MGYKPGSTKNTATAQAFDSSESALVGIYEISKLLASPHRLERTLAGVLALLSSFLDMRHGLIALLDKQGEPEVVVGSGWSETNAKKYFDRLPERAVGQIIATKMPMVIENVAAHGCLSAVLWSGSGEHSRPTPNFTPLPIAPNPRSAPRVAPPPAEEAFAAPPLACPGAENCAIVDADQRSDKEKLVDAMEQAGWVKAKAARLMGLTPRQIGYALQKHKISVKKF